MYELVKAVLAIGSGFAEINFTSSIRKWVSVNAYTLTIALHTDLYMKHNHVSERYYLNDV
jgi:hypothetical protein